MSEQEKPKHNPQKYSWKILKRFKSYSEAKSFKDSQKDPLLKINRVGPRGTLFAVKSGKRIDK
tara:strand:- start:48 stop:236 length:189 start_codon:yes stop_codon:yes gene_type:complete